jgi:hypothetical protein
VWFRTKIANEDPTALRLAGRFVKHHTRLRRRGAPAR